MITNFYSFDKVFVKSFLLYFSYTGMVFLGEIVIAAPNPKTPFFVNLGP